jgi:hypothetical protein
MPLGIFPPKITCHQEADGTWTATLFIEGRWHAQIKGCASRAEARREISRKYL